MKVFRIRMDVDRYQSFLPVDTKCKALHNTDGSPRSKDWSPPPVFVYSPKLKAGSFYNGNNAILIANQKATSALRYLFEMAGDLLPLPYKGEMYTLLNVTNCIDCLDQNETRWIIAPNGARLGIQHYVFRADRLSPSPIFKIPKERRTSLFVVEGLVEPEQEFREIVRREELKGLIFDEHRIS